MIVYVRTNTNTLKQILSLDEKYISISINLHGKDMTYYTEHDTQCHYKWLTMGPYDKYDIVQNTGTIHVEQKQPNPW
jgi:hypothetical protein